MKPHASLLWPLRADCRRVDSILDLLQHEREPATRADLAQELVWSCSLIEDAKDRGLYRPLAAHGHGSEMGRLRASSEAVRVAMEPVFGAVEHSVPIDVHHEDPEGFERDLDALCDVVRGHIALADAVLSPMSTTIPANKRRELRHQLAFERRRAIARPHPPRRRPARTLRRALQGLTSRFHDTSDQYRPGRSHIEG